ncbi:PREDICTED: uncharacterized protein LOC104788837 [Camelina sativa]|uniref:Uncharacterized protein LOC104788837 n=1 Tax=Camelina sativa TaxID=90675 RepID=A0ABM0ZAV7_CAMSA|nr:PREDICTED: uncharacterized protein LOC104788837 [Camelina sativa]
MDGKKLIILSEEAKLNVKVIGTIGITDGHPYQYRVVAWTNAKDKYLTKIVPTEGDPEFNEVLQISLDKNFPAKALFVDVFRMNSDGLYFVGRGKTLLPTDIGKDFYREVELSGFVEAGFLQLSLNLNVFEVLGYAI